MNHAENAACREILDDRVEFQWNNFTQVKQKHLSRIMTQREVVRKAYVGKGTEIGFLVRMIFAYLQYFDSRYALSNQKLNRCHS